MCIFCLLSSFKKGGKIQTGLNCEYDGLSEVMLSLSHSRHAKYFKVAGLAFISALKMGGGCTCTPAPPALQAQRI